MISESNINRLILQFLLLAFFFNAVNQYPLLSGSYKSDSLKGLVPICTVYGIQYKDVSSNSKKDSPHQNSDKKHCVLCHWNTISKIFPYTNPPEQPTAHSITLRLYITKIEALLTFQFLRSGHSRAPPIM